MPRGAARGGRILITGLRLTPLFLTFRQPYHWAGRVDYAAAVVLVEVETDDGLVGVGESVAVAPRRRHYRGASRDCAPVPRPARPRHRAPDAPARGISAASTTCQGTPTSARRTGDGALGRSARLPAGRCTGFSVAPCATRSTTSGSCRAIRPRSSSSTRRARGGGLRGHLPEGRTRRRGRPAEHGGRARSDRRPPPAARPQLRLERPRGHPHDPALASSTSTGSSSRRRSRASPPCAR